MADSVHTTRRAVLKGVALAGAAGVVAHQATAEEKFNLQQWLDTAEPGTVAWYHATRLAEAMRALDPSRTYLAKFEPESNYALVYGLRVPS